MHPPDKVPRYVSTDLHRISQFVMEEYESLGSSEAAFWKKYTDDKGERMSYSRVLTALKTARKQNVATEDAPAARDALCFFHGDLSARLGEPRPGQFEFRRGARYYVVTSEKEIAKRWRQLLEEDADVRGRWEAMKDEPVLLPLVEDVEVVVEGGTAGTQSSGGEN